MSGGFEGAIFDVDGVLVDSPHERAWRESLRELMEGEWRDIREETTWSPEAFTPQVYEQYMSGKPREAGARAVLEYFKVPDIDNRVDTYASHKQAKVVGLIEAGEFEAYPDALRLVLGVRERGILVAAASSSKNAEPMLQQIRLDTFAHEQGPQYDDDVTPGLTLQTVFDADVSGRDFARGKPDPEIFLTAAAELGRPPPRCFVVEDAASGIQAAKAGGMGGLGIARHRDEQLLLDAKADLVVTSLDDVDLDRLSDGVLAAKKA
jgi:beta-phosphoglucomutase-like phosphatase (HAD superfamily)